MMKVYYSARKADISDNQKRKLEKKLEKVHRILTRKPLEAHIFLSRQRHQFEAEITLRALNHTLVVAAVNADAFAAASAALDKLEKQAVRNKHKLIDVRRPLRQRGEHSAATEKALDQASRSASAAQSDGAGPVRRIVRSNEIFPKPLTVEEAILHLDESDRDHVAYRDAASGALRVLLRRRDGELELVEAG